MAEQLPDKEYLYGRYHSRENWRQKLYKKLAHKAYDVPEDDDMYVDNSKAGMGWKELAVLAATGVGGLAAYGHFFGPQSNTTQAPTQQVQQVSPVDSEYEVRFFDADGNPIQIPHISTRPKNEN